MTFRIRVRGGTAKSENLCDSCDFHERINFHSGEIVYACGNFDITQGRTLLLPSPVASCTGFEEKGFITKREFEKSAWILEVAKRTRKIGFIDPETWKAKKKKENASFDDDE